MNNKQTDFIIDSVLYACVAFVTFLIVGVFASVFLPDPFSSLAGFAAAGWMVSKVRQLQ